jgi:hypothetical protein
MNWTKYPPRVWEAAGRVTHDGRPLFASRVCKPADEARRKVEAERINSELLPPWRKQG